MTQLKEEKSQENKRFSIDLGRITLLKEEESLNYLLVSGGCVANAS